LAISMVPKLWVFIHLDGRGRGAFPTR
jgi:hypothetical protein